MAGFQLTLHGRIWVTPEAGMERLSSLVMIRVPLLCVSMLVQIVALSGNLGASS